MARLDSEINELYHVNMCRNLYCIKCEHFKPVRTRHCSVCNKCVSRFDHHCPWTDNCIGRGNLKVFIQFLFYTSFSLIFFSFIQFLSYALILRHKVIIGNSNSALLDVASESVHLSYWLHVLFLLIPVGGLGVGMSVVNLFVYQLKNVEKNLTTAEHFILKDRDFSPFDHGDIR